MERSPIEQLAPQQLARFLSMELETPLEDADAASIIRKQLEANVLPDLLNAKGLDAKEIEAFVNTYNGPTTFGGQLLAARPALTLISAIKLFAKQNGSETTSGTCARLLYFAAIAAAMARCQTRLSQLSDQELVQGFRWGMALPGAEQLRLLFADALAKLRRS